EKPCRVTGGAFLRFRTGTVSPGCPGVIGQAGWADHRLVQSSSYGPLRGVGRKVGDMGGSGGSEDFNSFYEASYGQLVAHLYAMTGDLGEAQDAAQEAFVRAWDRWHQVSTHDNPVAWVRLTGQRVAISRWRRARTAVRSWIRHGPVGPIAGPGPDTVALVEALRKLPEAQRSALVLHHMGGRSVAEIAAEAGVPVGTVKARLHRGRQALALLLGEEPAEAGHPVREAGRDTFRPVPENPVQSEQPGQSGRSVAGARRVPAQAVRVAEQAPVPDGRAAADLDRPGALAEAERPVDAAELTTHA
ncbi:SigE family RNA polymerase sigma factor, partial [Kitasatospora indigofera]|uniref:SigE family RNA polymerase sigma factor n=1 Tax=Kitasatospora indigofera TaxID=67307 RepID=UPI0036BCB8A0